MDELVKPNWHAAIVHFPIALLVLGSLIELFSFAGWRRSSLRWAGRWMLLLGALLGVPTTFVGIHALKDVIPGGLDALRATDPKGADSVWWHVVSQSVSTGLAVLTVLLWIAFSDAWRDRLSLLFKASLLAILGLTFSGAWLGGEMVYAHRIGPGQPGTELPEQKPTTFPTAIPDDKMNALAEAIVPEQAHVTTAGVAMAAACLCLALSARRVSQDAPAGTEEARSVDRIVRAFGTEPGGRLHSDMPAVPPVSLNHTAPVRPAAFWVLTLLILLGTVAGGLWTTAYDSGAWSVDELKETIVTPIETETGEAPPKVTRRLAHLVTGVVIVVDTLLLGLFSLAAPRSAMLLLIAAVPLILAMGIQIWLGVLLVLEGPAGLVTQFAT